MVSPDREGQEYIQVWPGFVERVCRKRIAAWKADTPRGTRYMTRVAGAGTFGAEGRLVDTLQGLLVSTPTIAGLAPGQYVSRHQ